MGSDILSVTSDMLVKNRAKRIIETNQDISTNALMEKLRKKGIPQNTIDELVFADETRQFMNVLCKVGLRYPLIKGKTSYERRQKLSKYLLSKGFDSNLVQRGIDEYFKCR